MTEDPPRAGQARVSSQLTKYGLGAAAVSALSLVSQSVSATIVPFSDSGSFVEGTMDDGDQPTITIGLADGSNLYLDPYGTLIDPGTTFEMVLGNGAGTYGGLWDNTGGVIGFYVAPTVLGSGSPINPTDPGVIAPYVGMPVRGGTALGDWTTGFTDQYVGFVTPLGNEGYLKVSWNPTSGLFSYNGGAIEDSGADLTTPAAASSSAPEPGTLALLCAGAVGLARRRRALKAAA